MSVRGVTPPPLYGFFSARKELRIWGVHFLREKMWSANKYLRSLIIVQQGRSHRRRPAKLSASQPETNIISDDDEVQEPRGHTLKCPVCLDVLDKPVIKVMSTLCGHLFCAGCLEKSIIYIGKIYIFGKKYPL